MTLAELTVVTPTLDADRYLTSCLESVAAQGIDGLEQLVVDSGSTDATLEIAGRFEHVTVLHCPGANQSQAINAGLLQARGEIVAWLNADDVYVPDALRFVLTSFRDDPGLDVLYGDCQVVGPEGEALWSERPGAYDFAKLLRRGNYIAQPAVFMRRGTFERVGYLDESLEYAMDYDLWLRVRGLRIEYVARTLARFRWHSDSKSSSSQLENWQEFRRILRKHGGRWTPELVWAYTRCLITMARIRVRAAVTGSAPLRPLTRAS